MTDELRPAFRTYETLDPAADEGDTLNLAWTRDERGCLEVDLAALLADELRAEAAGLPYLGSYLVRDPYGEETLGPAVAAAFGLATCAVSCGAGVVSLLHGLARFAPTVRVFGDTYPDFPYWVAQSGGACTDAPDAGVWFLERPSFMGDAFSDLAELQRLCADAARHGAVVIVDESNANYYPPAWSAAPLACAIHNLIVLRGFSKAYGLGGLRLAYAIAAPALTERIRGCLPPLLASSLSLRLGARVLALGDITAPLRTRIAAHKRETVALFARAGVDGLVPSSEYLPYVLAPAPFASRGITGKLHPMWSTAGLCHIYRLSVPLSDARIARLRQLLSC
jgi:hypothetical protein